jgi:hypothetical protein
MWVTEQVFHGRLIMAQELILTTDVPFANRAQVFATAIGRDPQRFGVSREDADKLVAAFESFKALRLEASNKYRRSKLLLDQRNNARDALKRIMERLGRMIRADERLGSADLLLLGMTRRPTTLRKSRCPQTRPNLFYMGSRHSRRVGRKVHLLRFEEPWAKIGDPVCGRRMAKPAGAWGVAVYVELIDEGEKIPRHPGELTGGRPWLLQLCTRGPIEAEFPVAERPMRVVYWARWVGMKGDMGPFSQTCVGEFEGQRLPNKVLLNHSLARRRAQRVTITTVRPELPGPVETIEALTCDAQRLLTEEAA